MTIAVSTLGQQQGQAVHEAVLVSENGTKLWIMSFGARLRDWQVPTATGPRSVVLGHDTLEAYLSDQTYFGSVAGRVANRIANSRFRIGEREIELVPNEGANHLHGGPGGLSQGLWNLQTDSAANAVRLSLVSPDGDMGYPGQAEIEVVYDRTSPSPSGEMR
jgi:aldose 1-epimerase